MRLFDVEMKIELTLPELRQILDTVEEEGTSQECIRGIASLGEAGAGDLSFLGNKKYMPEVKGSAASYVLLPLDYVGKPKSDQVFLRVENPSYALALVCAQIEQRLRPSKPPTRHPSAVIAESAQIGEDVCIGPHCVIEPGAIIGNGSRLDAQVYVGASAQIGADCCLRSQASVQDYCVLGDRVHLHAGVVIGSDGFGYETVDGKHEKVPQVGNVVIENDVEIGANTTIDRARFKSTVVGEGSKIDNLVQIGHNVQVGKHCLIVSQAGISGSTIIEDYVVIAGQAGITGHLRLGKGTVVGAQCGLHYDTEPGSYHRGTPGNPAMLANKIDVLRKRLPDLFKRVAKLEAASE